MAYYRLYLRTGSPSRFSSFDDLMLTTMARHSSTSPLSMGKALWSFGAGIGWLHAGSRLRSRPSTH